MKINLKHKNLSFFLFLFILLNLSFFLRGEGKLWAKTPKLQKTSVSLFLNEEKKLKVIHKKSDDKIKFQSKAPSICQVSNTGRLLGISPGKTHILVTITSKTGKIKKRLKAKVKVGTIILASTQKNLERGLKNPNGTVLLLKPSKETSFILPKGRFHHNLQIDMGKSKKSFHLETNKNSFLKEIQLVRAKKASFSLAGELPSFTSLASGSSLSIVTSGKKALLPQILMQANGHLSLFTKGYKEKKEPIKVYLSQQTDLSISGKIPSSVEIYVWENGTDSKVVSNRSIHYYAGVPSILELKKGAEGSLITTLDYKVPITVKNDTSSILEVHTPSLLKTIDIGSEKTVSGKK